MRLLMALLLVCFLGNISFAETDAAGKGDGPGRGKRQRAKKCKPDGKMHSKKFYDAIDATPEQQEQLKQIMDTHRQAVKNWKKENTQKLSDAHKALKEAKKSGDKDAVKAAKAQMKDIKKSRKTLHENLKQQLSEVLTEEQMQKVKKMHKGKGRHGKRRHRGMGKMYSKLNLTDEQNAEVKKLKEEAAEKCKSAKTREEKKTIYDTMRKKINKDVLTQEQRDKAKKLFEGRRKAHRDKFLKGLKTTDEQNAQIEKIMAAARKEAKDKPREERRKIMRAAHEKIRNDVLTDEQREKAKKMRRHGKGKRKCGKKGPENRDGKGSEGKGPEDGTPPPPRDDDDGPPPPREDDDGADPDDE